MWKPSKPSPRNHETSSSAISSIKDVCSPRKASILNRVRLAASFIRALPSSRANPNITIPNAETRIVIYFTSLRAVRSTFEDCYTVLYILRGFRVPVDERDLALNSGYLEDLNQILGKRNIKLPAVFIGGRFVGGAEEIKALHECGELKKIVQCLPVMERRVCDVCGDHRFVLCRSCNGSRKVFVEKTGFRVCAACNENGLIRCTACSSLYS